jgi:sigma-54 specific flagellar transcriptional regulator A
MPLNMQVKLLRVLQERKIDRVGSTKSIDIDVKIISATNKNLEDMIQAGSFREDLFYRINVIPIYVPTVRERADDIPLLMISLIEKISKRIVNNTMFSDEAIQAMCQYSWPGNIRELANFIERMVVICHDRVVTRNDVIEQLHKVKSRQQTLPLPQDLTDFNLKDYLANIEQQIINIALEKANGIVSSAAEYLNLRRTTLIEKMKKYQLITNE